MDNALQVNTATDLPSLGIEHIENLLQADFEVVHPTLRDADGKPVGTGLFITLAGPEHPDRKAISLNITRAVRAAMSRKVAAGERAVPDIKDPVADEAERLEHLAQCTLGWYRTDGKPCAPFSAAAVRELYKNTKSQWLYTQVMGRFYDAELFIKA